MVNFNYKLLVLFFKTINFFDFPGIILTIAVTRYYSDKKAKKSINKIVVYCVNFFIDTVSP